MQLNTIKSFFFLSENEPDLMGYGIYKCDHAKQSHSSTIWTTVQSEESGLGHELTELQVID